MAGAPSDHAIGAYDFELPGELVAQEPLAERDASRLLVLDRATGALAHRTFADLPDLLRPGDLLVDQPQPRLPRPASRPAPGRRRGRDPARAAPRRGAVGRHGASRAAAAARGRGRRRARPARAHRGPRAGSDGGRGSALSPAPRPPPPRRPRRRRRPRAARPRAPAALHPPGGHSLGPGALPDGLRPRGGLASPRPPRGCTSRPALLERLEARGVERAELVLHVGPGTFRPVESEDVRDHRVDPERYTVPETTAAAVDRARAERTARRRRRHHRDARARVGDRSGGTPAAGRRRDEPRHRARLLASGSWTRWSRTSTCPARRCSSW